MVLNFLDGKMIINYVFLRSDNLESKLWYPEFFQKTNKQIRFYYYATCFRSFYGRN